MENNANLYTYMPLIEAGVEIKDQKKKKVKLRLIKSGRSQRGNFYSSDVLQEAAPLFKGVKMYIDHPEEAKVGQPRSLRDWGATILESEYVPNDQTIEATVGVRDPWLWSLIEAGNEEGWLSEIGASINAAGPTRIGLIDGKRSNIVESIKVVRSVDFVPEASAGGQIQAVMESKLHGTEVNLMELTLKELMESYPGLVEQIQDATLESASTDKEFISGMLESALKDDELSVVILEAVASDESSMTAMVEGIEAARVEEFGYGFNELQESVAEMATKLEEANSAITALQESTGANGQVDLAAFEEAVRKDEAGYWHNHYSTKMTESAAPGLDQESTVRLTRLEEANASLEQENVQLRGDFAKVISKATAMSMLKESGLPFATQKRMLPQMVGMTEAEMKDFVEDKRVEISEIVGSTSVKGGSAGSANLSAKQLVESAQTRLDSLFGYDELTESGKPPAPEQPQEKSKTDLSHLGM